jgi:hypothetical protein
MGISCPSLTPVYVYLALHTLASLPPTPYTLPNLLQIPHDIAPYKIGWSKFHMRFNFVRCVKKIPHDIQFCKVRNLLHITDWSPISVHKLSDTVRLWLYEGSPGPTVFTGRQFASGATVWWTLLSCCCHLLLDLGKPYNRTVLQSPALKDAGNNPHCSWRCPCQCLRPSLSRSYPAITYDALLLNHVSSSANLRRT